MKMALYFHGKPRCSVKLSEKHQISVEERANVSLIGNPQNCQDYQNQKV